jgi:PleD family two-component response regulator
MATSDPRPDSATPHPLKRVAIVDGSADLLAWLEPILDPGDYDVRFLDSDESPYAQIRVSQPDLVVLTLRIEDVDSFKLLSMLKMDQETSRIQILTYSTEYEGQVPRHSLGEPADDMFASSMPTLPLN